MDFADQATRSAKLLIALIEEQMKKIENIAGEFPDVRNPKGG